MTDLIEKLPSGRPVEESGVLEYLNREAGPALRQAIQRINRLILRVEGAETLVGDSAVTVDWSRKSIAVLALTSNTELAFAAPGIDGTQLELVLGYTGAYGVTWPASGILWEGGAPPVLTSVAGLVDRVSFLYANGYYMGHARLAYA